MYPVPSGPQALGVTLQCNLTDLFHKFDEEICHVITLYLAADIFWSLHWMVGWNRGAGWLASTIPYNIVEIAIQILTAEFAWQVALAFLTENYTV